MTAAAPIALMNANAHRLPARPAKASTHRCLSCGEATGSVRRKYCSVACRQDLRRRLNARTGLLRALSTRYAAFYFTESMIVMDVLPRHSREIFSFIFPRTPGASPSRDFCRMSDMLGNAWWAERRRTNRKYRANQVVFEQARRNRDSGCRVKPLEIRTPMVNGRSLIQLRLGRKDLESAELNRMIKRAFRSQAKKHHPDRGGDSRTFRRIFRAYEELISWAENPTFIMRRGFPDKWFYDGERNRWVQPTPEKQTP